jgi:hypothetical protein
MIETDITLLVIQVRDAAGQLFSMISKGSGSAPSAYNAFINLFYQLYMSFKYNAPLTKNIKDWDEKAKIMDDLFYNRVMRNHEFIPMEAIRYADCFLGELVSAGIYNLSKGEYYFKEGV